MHPFLLHSPPISTYGACIVAALLLAWLWARRRALQFTLPPSHIDLLMPILVAAGLLGAWLFGAWTDDATGDQTAGSVLLGSLLLATAAGIAYALLAKIPLGRLGDLCAPPLALGIAVGRLGCFFAGCCYGKICDPRLGIRFPAGSFAFLDQLHHGFLLPDASQSLPVYPTQLYESAACLLLALLLTRLRPKVSGERFLALALGYAALRFPIEFLRADNPPVLHLGPLPLTFSQLACLAITLLAATTWSLRKKYAPTWNLLLRPSPF